MAEEEQENSYNVEIQVDHVVGGKMDRTIKMPPRLKSKRIIKREVAEALLDKIVIVGGDSDEDIGVPPAIIVEKSGETITRIMVKCPCGRHAELICEYEEDED